MATRRRIAWLIVIAGCLLVVVEDSDESDCRLEIDG
jgi:hypothetical protein